MVDLRPHPFGNYYLLERLAVGGMAEVYLAKCFGAAGYEKLVALKRILPTIAEDDEFIAMFIDEAKIAGQLSHANIASIFDLGKINSSYFIAMEYVSGLDLRVLWDRANENGGIPLAMACYFTQKICEGLDYAHRRRDNRGRPLGIIHRDVSPQNILVSYDGDVKVIDFGIAKAANRMVRTQTGILKGKFAYMAPEQARGEAIDHRSDIFAIGTMLYELVTGRRAFKADSDFALLEKVRKVEIVPPRKINPQLPKELEKIIAKAMSREAEQRYAWASSLAQELERFMRDRSLTCNKEQVARFVRNNFKPEFREEKKRTALYAQYQPDEVEGANEPSLDDDDEPITDVAASGDTVVRSDTSPSLHEAGTEVGEVPGSEFSDFGDETHQLQNVQATRAESDDSGPFQPAPDRTQHAQKDKLTGGHRPPWERLSDEEDDLARTEVGTNPLESSEEAELPTHLDAGPVEHTDPGEESDDEVANAATMIQPDKAPGVRPPMTSSPKNKRAAPSGQHKRPKKPRASRPSRPKPKPPPERTDVGPPSVASPEISQTDEGPRVARSAVARPVADGPRMSAAAPPQTATPRIIAALVGGLVLGLLLGAILVAVARDTPPNTYVVTTPRGAAVSLGKKVLCKKTPCAFALDKGSHELVFAAAGTAISRTVAVGDEPVFVDVTLRLKRRLRLVTDPRGARVTLDGELLKGTTPLTLPELPVGGTVELRIDRSGYQRVNEKFEVPDLSGPWTLKLQAKTTRYRVTSEPADAVIVEGDRTRLGKLDAKVAGDQPRGITVMRAGCTPRTLSLLGTGAENERRVVKLQCGELSASLTVTGAPRGAHVHLDGIPTARRNLRAYALTPGQHVVTVIKGTQQASFPVVLTAGQNEKVEARLR